MNVLAALILDNKGELVQGNLAGAARLKTAEERIKRFRQIAKIMAALDNSTHGTVWRRSDWVAAGADLADYYRSNPQ